LSFPNVSIGNPLHLVIPSPVIPDLIGNPLSLVIPDLIGNPEDSKDMDPLFQGNDRKSKGMTLYLSFLYEKPPVIPDLIGNPEDSKDMDPRFHGDDRKRAKR